MIFSTLLPLLLGAGALSSAQYLGSFEITNICPETVYIWSTADTVGPMQTLSTGQSFIEYAHRNPQTGGGITVFISKDPNGLNNNSPLLLLAYSADQIKPGEDTTPWLWYQLDTLHGSPFEGQIVWLGGDSCPEITWQDGKEPSEGNIQRCLLGVDMWLTLCARD